MVEGPPLKLVIIESEGQPGSINYCTDSSCLGAEFVGTQLVNAGYTNVGHFPGGVDEWAKAGQVVDSSLPAGS